MTPPFLYRRVGRRLTDEVYAALTGGASHLLISCRDGGTEYLLNALIERLQGEAAPPTLLLRTRDSKCIATLDNLRTALFSGITASFPTLREFSNTNSQTVFDILESLGTHLKQPYLFIAPDLGKIAHEVARHLLEVVRVLVSDGRLVVLLSGEYDLRDLVHGPNSEFNCANQYVLQGVDEETFRHTILHRSLRFEDSTIESLASSRLFEASGGNLRVADALLATAFGLFRSSRGASGGLQQHALQLGNAAQIIADSESFRAAAQLIAEYPHSWRDLEKLLETGSLGLDARADFPTSLESSGLVVRERDSLHFCSPSVEQAARIHYNQQTFADLYAAVGNWTEAFERYRKSGQPIPRPLSPSDRRTIQDIVQALTGTLYLQAHSGPAEVRRLFSLGMRYVLGFESVSYVALRDKLVLADEGFPDKESEMIVRAEFQRFHESPLGPVSLTEPLGRQSLAGVVEGPEFASRLAVIVAETRSSSTLSRDRCQFGLELMRHFTAAHSFASAAAATRARLAQRDEHVRVLNAVQDAVGTSGLNVRAVLQLLASGLRRLGYRRVLISLVDSTRTRLKCVLDSSHDDLSSGSEMIDYALDSSSTDIQTYVIRPIRVLSGHSA